MVQRSAEYSIQGFIYEFNKCLLTLLEASDDEEIVVNGIIEDIDVVSPTGTKAIQCKYHESNASYSLSSIYKPLIWMMNQYSINPNAKIDYVLYAYFPMEKEGIKALDVADLQTILKSKDKRFIKLIEEINNNTIDLSAFLKRFRFEIGKSLTDLQKQVCQCLVQEGFTSEDVNELFFPNAVQLISTLAIKLDKNARKIRKSSLINYLTSTKQTAVSRWTLELLSYKKILKARRTQLSNNLAQNSRLRYLIFDPTQIEEFDKEIVNFIEEFISKYNSKVKLHDQTPIFCIKCEEPYFDELRIRLHKKGIELESGIIANYFDSNHFMREPQRIVKDGWIEFSGRICRYSTEIQKILNQTKCDDLFVVGNDDASGLDTMDLNFEVLNVNTFDELKYLFCINKAI